MLSEQQSAKLPKKRADVLATPLSDLKIPAKAKHLLREENARRKERSPMELEIGEEKPLLETVGDWLGASQYELAYIGGPVLRGQIEAACEALGVTRDAIRAEVEARQKDEWEKERAYDSWCNRHDDLFRRLYEDPELFERIRKQMLT